MKKKFIAILCILTMCIGVLAACGSGSEEPTESDVITLKCLADTTPHKEILEHAAPALEEAGIKLDIVSETWDETWNEQVENGDVDFNFDAYQPYLDEWNEANNGHLVGAGDNPGIHFEPLVMMSEKYEKMVDEICKELHFTSLRFNRLDDMLDSVGIDHCKLCTYCWDGKE